MIGDFTAEYHEPIPAQFSHDYNAVNIIHENPRHKRINNSSCIDLIITSSPNGFQTKSNFCTGLSDFHKLVITVLKTFFRKTAPKEIHYRDFDKFNRDDFKTDLRQQLAAIGITYENLEQEF